MFTGIITDIGTLISIYKNGDLRVHIHTNYDMAGVAIGASIACGGVCLTVVEKDTNSFKVDISAETITCTNIRQWKVGTKINLERALRVGDELGGHIVSGHVDGLAVLESITAVDASNIMVFRTPASLAMFIAAKGSVTLDGVSLTVNEVYGDNFKVNIIPHTLKNTTLGDLSPGCDVNLEIDTLARYVSRIASLRGRD